MVAQAFLIGKTEYLDGKREALLTLVQALNAGERNHHAKWAIVFPGIPYAVEMRTKEQGLCTGGTGLVAPDQVANGILLDGHASSLHPLCDSCVCLAHCC